MWNPISRNSPPPKNTFLGPVQVLAASTPTYLAAIAPGKADSNSPKNWARARPGGHTAHFLKPWAWPNPDCLATWGVGSVCLNSLPETTKVEIHSEAVGILSKATFNLTFSLLIENLHFIIENLGLARVSCWDEVFVQYIQNVTAN